MLTLTRRDGEKIVIGDDIVVTVYRAQGATRVVVEAPKEISIRREELINRKRKILSLAK